MASATGRKGQDGGLALRLELEQGRGAPRARVLAGPAELAPGVRLASLVGEPVGPASELGGAWRVLEARLEIAAEALARAVEVLVGREVAGWRIGQVALDLGGDAAVLTLTGPADAGWPAVVQIELAARIEGAGVRVSPRRVWATGPLAPAAGDLCARIASRLADGSGVVAVAGGVWIDPGAALRRAVVRSGGRAPRTDGVVPARVRVEGPGVRVQLVRQDRVEETGLFGQVAADMSGGAVDDPLAGLRAALRSGDRRRALAELDRFPALPGHPGARRLARALAQVRAELLRFSDRGAAALRAWLAAAPDDPAAWWRFVVQHARAGDAEGVARGLAALERTPGPPGAALRRRAAWATVLAQRLGAAGRAVAGLEEVAWEGSAGALAAGWRALALARAGDAGVAGEAVEAAVDEAIALGGARAWCDAAALRARVAEMVLRSGRVDAEAAGLLRRLIGASEGTGAERQGGGDRAEETEGAGASAVSAEVVADDAGHEADPDEAARVLAGFYARHGRWEELVELLGRALVRQAGPARAATLERLAEVHRRLGDAGSAEQALRLALAEPGAEVEALHEALVACLEDQGRSAAAAEHAAGCVAAELTAEPPATTSPARARLLLRLARLRRAALDDLAGAARAFEAYGCYAELPVDGLEALALRYREQGRYEALAAVLRLRLAGAGAGEGAAIHRRLAELFDGPLPRPLLAAEHHARAFLGDPSGQAEAGERARALLLTAGAAAAGPVLDGLAGMSEAAGRWVAGLREALARATAGEGAAARIEALTRELGRASGARAIALARELAHARLAAGDEEGALGTCLEEHGAGDIPLLALAAGLLERRERWPELVQVCERAAGLAGAAGDGEAQAGWLTRAAQVCVDHAEHPRRAMHDARRLLLEACAAGPRCEAARASLIPLAFAERRFDEVRRAGAELRALGGLDYDVLVLAALTEAWLSGQVETAQAIGPRHPEAVLRRLLWPALARIALEVAREGALAQLDAVLTAAAALVAGELRAGLRAWAAGRPLHAGVALALGRLVEPAGRRGLAEEAGDAADAGLAEGTGCAGRAGLVGGTGDSAGAGQAGRGLAEETGDAGRGRGLRQLAAFMVPQGAIAAEVAGLPVITLPIAGGRESALEAREAIAEVLSAMVKETGGIRAPGEPPGPPDGALAGVLALAEAELGRLRAALGLRLPVYALPGGPDGGVGIRNDREPGLVVYPALARLPAGERRFRLALAAVLIRGGLAIVLDPQGASLHELLAALHHLADPAQAPGLPGAQTIVRTWRSRGWTGERLTPAQREALAAELRFWRRDRAGVARLAYLLRRDGLGAAAGLSGALDGALLAIGRDARLLGEPGERAALQVLATDEAQWLLRSAGLFDEERGST